LTKIVLVRELLVMGVYKGHIALHIGVSAHVTYIFAKDIHAIEAYERTQ